MTKLHYSNKFKLDREIVLEYKDKTPPFGFNGLGEFVYKRSYSRIIEETGENEIWYQTVERVVNGVYGMQKKWIMEKNINWDEDRAQKSATEMYNRIFNMKFLPPGRGLWGMGSPITEEKKVFAALNNCGFVSTVDIDKDPSKPFIFLMDSSMLGIGTGFDTKGEGKIIIKGPSGESSNDFLIPDSREGWLESVKLLLDSYFLNHKKPIFDYSAIRLKGVPVRGLGGIASGPDCLIELHTELETILKSNIGNKMSTRLIVDIMNMIGKCVVAGNIRRTAEIAFGDYKSDEFLDLKNYKKNPERLSYGWTSNNSVFSEVGMDYEPIINRIADNGEPGFAWIQNMREYSRMNGTKDYKDMKAGGGNPCLEQTLESYELCCLVETFPYNHSSKEDFLETLKFAFLYAKSVTLGESHWEESQEVMNRNRRIGTSMSGIAQFINKNGISTLEDWCNTGYDYLEQCDAKYSKWFGIPMSIKRTSIKPSGTVSLLAGATPGMHYPIAEYYIRRVRVDKNSPLLKPLIDSGYRIEPCVTSPETTVIVEFPVHAGDHIRKQKEVSCWEQLSLSAFLQRFWADNQVSCTINFDPETETNQLKPALEHFQYHLKGVSFIPNSTTSYPQLPYEEITQSEYESHMKNISHIHFNHTKSGSPKPELYCDTDTCNFI